MTALPTTPAEDIAKWTVDGYLKPLPPALDLDSLFDSQPQTQGEDFKRLYGIARAAFKDTAHYITELLPADSPEKTLAIRHVWYAMMIVNSALSRNLR